MLKHLNILKHMSRHKCRGGYARTFKQYKNADAHLMSSKMPPSKGGDVMMR